MTSRKPSLMYEEDLPLVFLHNLGSLLMVDDL